MRWFHLPVTAPLWTLPLLAILSLSGCANERTDDTDTRSDAALRPEARESGYLPPTTPEAVLANNASSYANRDIDAYAETLHSDFAFVASGGGELSFAMDLQSTRAMFEEESLDSLSVEFVHGGSIPSTDPSYPAEEGFREIGVDEMRIRLVSTAGGERKLFDIASGPFRFTFASDGNDPPRWSIVRMVDLETPSSPGESDH